MAQIHALTPEGRLPTAAVAHVKEIAGSTWEADIPLTADWRTDVGSDVTAYRSGNVVTVSAWRLVVNTGVTGAVIAYTIPPGYRPIGLARQYIKDQRDRDVFLNHTGQVTITDPADSVTAHSFTFITSDPPPTQ